MRLSHAGNAESSSAGVEKVLSAVAVVTGMVSTSRSIVKTSQNITLLLGIPFIISHSVLSVVLESLNFMFTAEGMKV